MERPIEDQAKILAWDDIHEGMEVALTFAVSAEDMTAFAALSGDHNPLHRDSAFARTKGFDGPVVYGALLVAQVSRLVGMHLPGRDCLWTGLKMDFHKPLMVGESAQLQAVVQTKSDAVRMLKLALKVFAGDRTIIAKGSAEVVVQ